MASTQKLTELPAIQYTGMDYVSVLDQIQEIVQSHPNWKKNWTEFYNSEAGVMLTQLMAWICDNLGVRQDLIYNENFLATATSVKAKTRLLNQIEYLQKSASASIVPISIEYDNELEQDTYLSCYQENGITISKIVESIHSFSGMDINGAQVNYEILPINVDGKIDYLKPIKLTAGSLNYSEDSEGNQLVALQGKTIYREFYSEVSDGPVFELPEDGIDLSSLVVFDITNSNLLHKRVDSFVDYSVLNDTSTIKYIVEKNDNGKWQIRYPSQSFVTFNNSALKDRMFIAGNTIGVIYRTCNGSDGNIAANYLSISDNVNGDSVTITNILSGYNGRDEETLDEAVSSGPLAISTMNRAVTISDFNRILKSSPLIKNCISFSPDNEPENFKNYYGRRINPQEIFSFAVLNKNINRCPANKLNYFPWVELNKESILNEKYSFGDGEFNKQFKSDKDIYKNLYINDEREEFKEVSYFNYKNYTNDDGGQWYFPHYNYKKYSDNGKLEKDLNGRLIRNAKILRTSSIIQDAISTDLSNETDNFECKLHYYQTGDRYLKNVKIDFIDNDNFSFTTANNVLTDDKVHAKYVSISTLGVNEVIDCMKYKYIKLVIDDNLEITVDIQREVNVLSDAIAAAGGAKVAPYSHYLYIDNEAPTNINEKVEAFLASISDLNDSDKASRISDYINSNTSAMFKMGIKQLINKAVNEEAAYVNEVAVEEDIEEQARMYKGAEMSGTMTFIDLGRQEENPDKIKYCKIDYKHSETNNVSNFYAPEQFGKFYRIKINGEIYAIRLDRYTYEAAYDDFYNNPILKEIAAISEASIYYDYYSYIGRGVKRDLGSDEYISKALELDGGEEGAYSQELNNICAQNRYFNRELVSSFIIDPALNFTSEENGGKAIYRRINDENEEDNISCEFSLNQLSATLEYLFSIFNNREKTIYKYVDGTWYDIKNEDDKAKLGFVSKSDEYILNGNIRTKVIKRANYNYNSSIPLEREESSNTFDRYEYDLRIERINRFDNTFSISSVSENEITKETEPAKIEFEENFYLDTYDFIQEFLGYRKTYIGQNVDYSDENNPVASIVGSAEYNLVINSLKTGEQSTLYFVQTVYDTDEELISFFGLKDGFPHSLLTEDEIIDEEDTKNDIFDRAISEKSFGIKRIEMYVNGPSNDIEAFINPYDEDIKEVDKDYQFDPGMQQKVLINVGDFIFTDNDINYSTLDRCFLSYIKNRNNIKLALNKYDNFFYSKDEKANELAKPAIVGIEGEAVKEVDGIYYIDENKSNYGVKISGDVVDTNNYYAIPDTEYDDLGILKNGRVVLNCKNMDGYNILSDGIDGLFYGYGGLTDRTKTLMKEAAGLQLPIMVSIDNEVELPIDTRLKDTGMEDIINEIIINNPVKTVAQTTGAALYTGLIRSMKTSGLEKFENSENVVLRKSIGGDNKLIFSSLDRNNGKIVFYYPEQFISEVSGSDDDTVISLGVNLMYKSMFGTNITNPDFYELYPKEAMADGIINSPNVVHTINEETGEYFYAPTQTNRLKFIFRGFVETPNGRESKFGDYYIEAVSDNGFESGYTFYLIKAASSVFPDIPFYVHFVNDRTFEYKRTSGEYKTEEDKLKDYMRNYQILGTELHLLKPYFKTFDIVAKINYDANYDLSIVKENVVSSLSKYKIENIESFEIGNTIYRSDIFKAIMSAKGVESAEIDYFGYDATDAGSDQKFFLENDDNSDFCAINVLADTTDKHGLILSYEKVNNGAFKF